MPNRREFLKNVAGASAGIFLLGSGVRGALQQSSPAASSSTTKRRREITIGGRRVKTVNAHAHTFIPEATDLVKGTKLETSAAAIAGQVAGRATVGPERLEEMNGQGIDVEALSINPFWYAADRDMARRLIDLQNEKLAAMCAKNPDRFVAYATVALQFPELAAEQLEEGMKRWGLRRGSLVKKSRRVSVDSGLRYRSSRRRIPLQL